MLRYLRNILIVFLLLSAHLAAKATIYYVTYNGQSITNGWQTTTTLANAISKAVANDEIWIQGSENATAAYTVPHSGYTIKSGIKIYGGFKGTETNISQREYVGNKRYKLKYRTMLTGDIDGNDKINDANFIFPEGEATNNRTDNADHVLVLDMNPTQESGNNNTYPTIVNGLTIARGHYKDGNGAGILVTGNNTNGGVFRIEQCFFLANYASKGGAIYVAASVKHTANDNMIDRCAFFNNAAGVRTLPSNSGAAIYALGNVKIVNSVIYNNANGGINGTEASDAEGILVVNSTITRNSGSGIEGQKIKVYNTVVWGNTTISTTDRPGTIKHCAFIGAAEGEPNYNVSLAEKNLDAKGPAFATPSLRIGYDSDFNILEDLYPSWNWESQGETTLVDKGGDDYYVATSFGNEDLAGDPRIEGNAIDIGAYEYLPVASSHIRYVMQGGTGDGTSWDKASGNLQRMIDDLAETGGEVWVAEGTYEPVSYLVSDKVYTASFRMRGGVSVYGGFSATNPESSKNDRQKGTMPWEFTNETILQGQGYAKSDSWGAINSSSRHVVWFAPLTQEGEQEVPFSTMTYLDGVTVEGGYASGGNGADDFLTDRGAGIYMKGDNVSVVNCIVKNSYATGPGGGIYMDGGGRVQRTLVFNNVSNGNGGAIYTAGAGMIRRCMLTNNQSRKGAGIYLEAKNNEPEMLQLSTCVVSNNTSTHNGAVYCDKGGVVVHNTIVNNLCTKTTDTADGDAAQTGGLYIDGYALLVNSVLWNNRFGSVSGTDIPVYVKNPSAEKVRFRYNAISGAANAVWNSTYQEETLFLASPTDEKSNMPEPDFDTTNSNLAKEVGVQTNWTKIDYFWPTAAGSALWSAGLEQGRFPADVLVAAELDLAGNLFSNKPSIGASYTKELLLNPDDSESGKLILYVSPESAIKDGDGRSWEKPFRSINKAITYFAGLSAEYVNGRTLEIRVLEGDLWPRYSFVNEDPKSATINLQKTQSDALLRLVGGYHRTSETTAERNPLTYRSIIEGNREGEKEEEGVYHVLTVEGGAKVELDGFHVVNGYAAGQAAIQHGAGLLAYDGAEVTLVNCIFEDNTAVSGAAVYAEGSAKVTMRNCVVNNNTNTDASSAEAVVYCANNANLTLEHVSFLNNVGAAPANLGSSSFALKNTSGNSAFDMETTGIEGAKNFANPANDVGAKLGFDTYLGGYAVYRPLTSSNATSDYIINKVSSGTSENNKQDITTINDRDLGGVPDLGAYEAILPKKGKVIYVRSYNTVDSSTGEELDGTPDWNLLSNHPDVIYDGSSWDTAIHGNAICNVNQERGSNEFYVVEKGALLSATVDRKSYSSTYNNETAPYGTRSKFYGKFFDEGTPGIYESTGNKWNTYSDVDQRSENIITNNRDEVYVSGLQYAVEKAAVLNKKLADGEAPVVVWVGGGIYTDYKGFVIRDGVKVYGGFPKTGNPDESDRKALLTQYAPVNEANSEFLSKDYETILQIRKEVPMTWSGNIPTVKKFINDISDMQRHSVLYQPDVCLPTWAPDNDSQGYTGGNSYRYPGSGSNYIDNTNYVEYKNATWDGFTVRHGYIRNVTSNRDGGAGIRVFRGVTLENMVVVNNYNHGSRSRGGGLYMDGVNSAIFNSFLLYNMAAGSESYGGGAYMIVGTGYNMAIANNFVDLNGGGLFIESATFYNNTVAYNRTNTAGTGAGAGITQWSTNGRPSNLLLYNCLFYGNDGNTAISSSAPETFQNAHNCYVHGSVSSNIVGKFLTSDGNSVNSNLANPFAAGADAQSTNNYRLSSSSACINAGTEDIKTDDGKDIPLPATDADFTDRVKDCTVDIGAYERNNQDNVKPDLTTETGKAIYYVTQNGAGTANGDSPANAACAMKLQEVLNAAGEYAAEHFDKNVIVKVAGYEGGSFIYHVNRLADENNPQSYSYSIPYGVTVMGGYNEGINGDANWNDDKRDITKNRTVFSGIKQATATTQEVQGYHTVTFKKKPAKWTGTDKQAIIDGVYIQDGSATSLAGGDNDDTKGGAAIVPAWAHVRNCVIQDNKAKQGGGLYVLPGGWVSGCVIKMNNAEEEGGGIYAKSNNSQHAYFVSNTIADNTALRGGGVYIEKGAAMTLNSVIWRNTANSDQNVSGTVNELETDAVLNEMAKTTGQKWYPFNNCYVGSIELPGNLQNTNMESSLDIYFANNDYHLKNYSPLINHGLLTDMQEYLTINKNVSEYDMMGLNRMLDTETMMDVGAFAFEGQVLDNTKLLTRIFVSQNSDYVLSANEKDKDYMGKTFYTPFTWLGDALEYIRTVRENNAAAKNVEFEIYVASGTYKPKYRREDDPNPVTDQRQNSFVVPYGVKIYGGFTGTELYSSQVDGDAEIKSIEFTTGTQTFTPLKTDGINVTALLAEREGSDFNDNQVKDAWEMAGQTILSGNINVSSVETNVYHVVYSTKDTSTGAPANQTVLLDGVTIQDGRTLSELDATTDNPKGRGGGIYSDGVDYTVVNSRLLNNKAVRGGGAFIRNASLTIVNSMLAGNYAQEAGGSTDRTIGGGVFVNSTTSSSSLKAVNTLWANNESEGSGGAIGANGDANNRTIINLMNNTFVMNKAKNDAVLYHTAATTNNVKVVNTLMWGNESTDDKTKDVDITYSASDKNYNLSTGNSLFGPNNGYYNIFLSNENLALDGPRFEEPSMKAGLAGYDLNSKWNPIAVSPLTDHGNGMMYPVGTVGSDGTEYVSEESQAYKEWFENYANKYAGKYMLTPEPDYYRYSGPNDENGNPGNRPIDIGVYEYQYRSNFSTMDKIYVDVVSSGKGTGESWQNATDDLRGALIGAANPESSEGARNVYIKGGDYPWSVNTSGNSVFPVHIGGKSGLTWSNLNIVGSCTGAGDEQDFSKPTIIRRHPYVPASGYLMEISSSHGTPKPVTISGLTFNNGDVGDNVNVNSSGVKVASNNSTLTMKQVAFRNNPKNGLEISSNIGKVLLVNALFADNDGTGLVVSDNLGNTTLVNTTFANNGTDMTSGLTNVYNSTSWENGTQNMQETAEHNNKVFAANTSNDDIEKGPNFYDPLNADKDLRDYRIRPSLTLLNSGSNDLYKEHALNNATEISSTERDLYNVPRVVDSSIDIGAYEYRAPLQQIIYVKEGVVKDNDGKSWETALTDLQNAANLAGIYSRQNQKENEDAPIGYVFVHNNVEQGLDIQLDNIKIYGGMNDEVTQKTVTDDIVKDLLDKRVGLLERTSTNRSQLTGALTINGNSVVDGFEVNVSPVIEKGILATSVVTKDVSGTTDGILYNTLLKGDVSGVKTVNVTATGSIGEVTGNSNNRTGAVGDNKYVTTDDWEYQLNETSTDIDATGTIDISTYIGMVGHNRDIAGNKRIRKTVDNGCFETWNITNDMTADNVVAEDDYPHGKSVVYVRHTDGTSTDGTVYDGGAELLIEKNYTDAAPFNPGFLLLEHHAGLRANNKAVGLTHFAVERNIDATGKDMAVMPFEVTRTEGMATLSLYNAATRAGYNYQYSATDGAWERTNYNANRTPIITGWLLEGTAGSKVRFYGDSYVENVDARKNIELIKNNFNEPWTSSSAGGNKFTHKENMSWNLFGSPYLCAMNYKDMQYGRVMYGYQNGAYITLNTIDKNTEGYIPAGDAVFTQTATLKERETLTVEIPAESNQKYGTAYQGSTDMTVSLSRAYTTRAAEEFTDKLQLKAVLVEESRNDFDINMDGVKWMSADSIPQIYAMLGKGRYSLLSAVSIEGEVNVGVTLPDAGMYTFAIPEGCDKDEYETVVLKDNVTGKAVDLLEGDYEFSTTEGGELTGRFTISFNRALGDRLDEGLRVWCPARNVVKLSGTESGDVITIYSSAGVVIATRIASSSLETISATIQGVAIVEVQRDGKTIIKKVKD